MKGKCVLTLLLLFSLPAFGQETRGMGTVKLPAAMGGSAPLYKESWALIIGVSDYLYWPKLPGVKQDVPRVKQVLEEHSFEVETLMNLNSEQLKKAFDEFINTHGQDEQNRLLFYFAGHGHTITNTYGGEMGYIVPVDAPLATKDERGFKAKALGLDLVEVYAKNIQSKHALFLFDSCFSGSLFSATRSVPLPISNKARLPVRQFITSGGAEEPVTDKSIFCDQFVEGLRGEADIDGDGYITGTDLSTFLQDKVITYSRDRQHPQYGKIPDPRLDKGDFVFQVVPAAQQTLARQKEQATAPEKAPAAQPAPAVTPAPTAQRPKTQAPIKTLAVTTVPPGADVSLDAVGKGRSPLTIADITEGEHTVAIALSGYRTQELSINVTRYKDQYEENVELRKSTGVVSSSSGIDIAKIPAGAFMMGGEQGESDELPVHKVTFSKDYGIATYEVTNRQFCDLMNWALDRRSVSLSRGDLVDAQSRLTYLGIANCKETQFGIKVENEKLAPVSGRENHPVVGVSWFGAVAFCNFLSERDGREKAYDLSGWRCDPSKTGYRLPTEAEWEYAARSSDGRQYPWGNEMGKKNANFADSSDPFESLSPPFTQSGGPTTPVGFYNGKTYGSLMTEDSRSPFWIYDMTGNVQEWCGDWKGQYGRKEETDPKGPAFGLFRVCRGGTWASHERGLRCTARSATLAPGATSYDTGFRVAMSF
ncbi:MAG: SUMF1/EgtB/PvdO family nonheme iron enzyme [Spirochaetes bacterium]|nr:SUMF1/EgtB/PvdO family nonheme iron enzyme [Spirochaetota bacterium]